MARNFNASIHALVCFLIAISFHVLVGAQETSPAERNEQKAKSSFVKPDSSDEELRKEVEPGVWVYGRSHRFAEVGNVQAFDTSPDGRTIVCATGSSKLKFFDLEENRVTAEAGEPGETYSGVMYSADGRFVFANGQGGRQNGNYPFIRVFDAIDQTALQLITTKVEDKDKNHAWFHVQRIAVSADAKFIAIASHNEVQVREVESGDLIFHDKELGYSQGMAFSPDEQNLFIGCSKFRHVDLSTGELKTKSESNVAKRVAGQTLAVSLSKNLLATPGGTGVSLFSLDEDRSVGTLKMPSGSYPQKITFSDDGAMISVACWRQSKEGGSSYAIVVLDVETKKVVKDIQLPSQGLTRMRFSFDNSRIYLAANGIYGVLEVSLADEDSNSEDVVATRYPHGPAKAGLLHPDGESFMTCSEGGEVTWFDFESGEATRSINRPGAKSMMFNNESDQVLLVSQWGGGSQSLMRVNYSDGKAVKAYEPKAKKKSNLFKQMRSMLFAGGPQVSQSQSSPIDAKYSEDGLKLHVLTMGWEFVSTVSITGGGSEQRTVLGFSTMDIETGKKLASLEVDTKKLGFKERQWIQMGAVNPNGKQIAVGNNSQKLFVLDVETGEVDYEVKAKENAYVRSVEFSPDGRFWLCLP